MWPLYALLASILWGVSYALIGNLLKTLHTQTVILVELGLGVLFLLPFLLGNADFRSDLRIVASDGSIGKQLLLAALVFNLANFLIVFSVRQSNAVVVSLLEITYPLFVVLFSWLIFRENHLTGRTAVGGLLIMLGVALIYCKGGK